MPLWLVVFKVKINYEDTRSSINKTDGEIGE